MIPTAGRRPLILFGGGLDSCAMVEFYHTFDPVLLYFDYGQKAVRGEMAALAYFSTKYGLARIVHKIAPEMISASPLTSKEVVRDAKDHAQNYIPGRNLLLSAIAYSYACAHNLAPIMLGASPAPPESAFHDAKIEFQLGFNKLVEQAYPDSATWLFLPMVTGDRREYLSRALFQEPNLFKVAFTCYESTDETECGVCVHCQQKIALATQLSARMK